MTQKLRLQISSTASLELDGYVVPFRRLSIHGRSGLESTSAERLLTLSNELYGSYREAGSRLCDVLRRITERQTEDHQAVFMTLALLFQEFAIFENAGLSWPVFVRTEP